MEVRDRSDEFLNERIDGEVDLYQMVCSQFMRFNMVDKIPILSDYFNKNDLMKKKPNVQKFYLNKFFNIQLLQLDVNTSAERYCLITDGSIEDWINLFNSKIMPFLAEHDLPRVI